MKSCGRWRVSWRRPAPGHDEGPHGQTRRNRRQAGNPAAAARRRHPGDDKNPGRRNLPSRRSGLEDRNAELVEAVYVMRETASKNIMKIAGVEKAFMLEKATSARLQQTLRETREDLS